MGVAELYKAFPEQTSCHGVPHIKRVQNSCGRLLWALLTITAFTLACLVTIQLVDKYERYQVDFIIERKPAASLPFPAVTICNVNPIRYTEWIGSGTASSVAGIIQNPSNPVSYPNTTGSSSSRKRRSVSFIDDHSWSSDSANQLEGGHIIHKREIATNTNDSTHWAAIEDILNYMNYTAFEAEAIEIMESFASLTEFERATYGHQVEIMLISCTYDRRPCSPQNFTHFFSPVHGNCFTFNSGMGSEDGIVHTTSAGSRTGLQLMLYVEQNEYIPQLAERTGIQVTINGQNTVPHPENDGITAAPGEATRIGVRRVELERLGAPYADCKHANTGGEYNLYNSSISDSYTQQACISSCIQTNMVATCGCFHPLYPYSIYEGSSVPVCSNGNADQASCMVSLLTTDSSDCSECTPRCQETLFERAVTTAYWPSNVLKTSVIDGIIGSGHPGISTLLASNPEYLYKEVVRLDVYYEDLSYESIIEQPAYSWQSLLSDVGGQLALWIGMSALTCLEYVELLLMTVVVYCTDCRKRRRKMVSTGIQAYHPSYNDRVKEQLAIIKVSEDKDKGLPPPGKAKTSKADRQRLVSGSSGNAETAAEATPPATAAAKKKRKIKKKTAVTAAATKVNPEDADPSTSVTIADETQKSTAAAKASKPQTS